jgi:hypothetical protein
LGAVYVDLPNYFFAKLNRFGANGLMLFLRSVVDRPSLWKSTNLGWPDASNEPSSDDNILGGRRDCGGNSRSVTRCLSFLQTGHFAVGGITAALVIGW